MFRSVVATEALSDKNKLANASNVNMEIKNIACQYTDISVMVKPT